MPFEPIYYDTNNWHVRKKIFCGKKKFAQGKKVTPKKEKLQKKKVAPKMVVIDRIHYDRPVRLDCLQTRTPYNECIQ